MILSLFASLGINMWWEACTTLQFEEEAWKKIVDAAEENGFNQIVLDLGEGVQYKSHPELSVEGAWSAERVREEVLSLRARGIELIPKLNFSATHHLWLKDYRRMMGLPKYYEVCRDLIREVYEMFDKPRFFHLAMDEEGEKLFFDMVDIVAYRRGEFFLNDLQFLFDCVKELGAKPWIWLDPYWDYPEEFKERFPKDSVMLSPWYYRGLARENFTPLTLRQEYIDQFTNGKYKPYNLQYVEDDPFHESKFRERFLNTAVPAAEHGYDIVPCASIIFGNTINPDEIVKYFTENAPKEQLAGFMVAPWKYTQMENVDEITENITLLRKAIDKYLK